VMAPATEEKKKKKKVDSKVMAPATEKKKKKKVDSKVIKKGYIDNDDDEFEIDQLAFLAPMLSSVNFQPENALYPWADSNSGPKIFNQEKFRHWLTPPNKTNWHFKQNSSSKTTYHSGDSLYEIALDFCTNFGATAPVQKVAMATASAEFKHKSSNKTMTSFARATSREVVTSINMPKALNTEQDRKSIRDLLLDEVKKDVDAISNLEDARDFVERYGPVIFSTADFGGAICATTNSSMNESTSATSMKTALIAEMRMADVSVNASAGSTQKTSSANHTFTYDMVSWGGDTTLVGNGEINEWRESLKLKSDYPLSLVDQSFASIEVLAEWRSDQESLLENAVSDFITAIDSKLYGMVVERPIAKDDKKGLLEKNGKKMEFLVDKRNTEKAGSEYMFNRMHGRLYSNGVRACNLNIQLLNDFNTEIERVDQPSTALKSWAELTRRKQIKSQKAKNWGVLGHDSTSWNYIFEIMEEHWKLVITDITRITERQAKKK